MRSWSVHPKYLDRAGLLAVWREGLLAKAVIEGKTKGYKNHPQLDRFRKSDDENAAINTYLHIVADEAERRGYSFKREKLSGNEAVRLYVTNGQLNYESEHLKSKLSKRNPRMHKLLVAELNIEPHPMMIVVDGPVEEWEKVK